MEEITSNLKWRKNIFERIKDHKRLFYLAIITLLVIALPLTIFLSSQKTLQEIRTKAGLEEDIEVLTQKLVTRKGANTDQISVAIQRKAKMKKLARQDPDKFLLNAISDDIRKTLPQEAQASIERKVEIEGSIIEVVDDNESPTNKKSAPSVILKSSDSEGFVIKSYTLFLREGQSPKIGAKVKVKGYVLNKVMVPISFKAGLQSSLPNVLSLNQASAAVLGVSTIGNNKKIAVISVTFPENDYDRSDFSREELEKIYFSGVKSATNYLKKASFNKLSFVGDINDIYEVTIDSQFKRADVCDVYETGRGEGFTKNLINKAKIQAGQKGIVWSQYEFVGFIFPYASGLCSGGPDEDEAAWGSAIARGVGNIDTNAKPYHFLNGNYCAHSSSCTSKDLNFYGGLMAHELGHNLGLSHANGLNCGNQIIGTYSNCKSFTYADRFDLIGGAWTYQPHPSASNQNLYLGYIPDSNKITVTRGNVRPDGLYTLYSLSKQRSNQTQLIRIPRPVEGGSYYLEYRSRENSDVRLPDNVFKGAIIRLSEVPDWRLKDENGNYQNRNEQTYLIDMGNTSPKTSWLSFLNPTFKDGQVFDDIKNRLKITQVSRNESEGSVTLKIAFIPPPCELDNPALLQIEPRQSGLAGEKITYELSITNNNSPSCSQASFDLSAQAPTGWGVEFPTNGVSIPSGQATTVTANITSPRSVTVDGSPYTTQITVQNRANSTYKRTKQLKYDIELPPPALPIGYHETLTCTETKGWTCDPNNFATPLNVDFYIDGALGSGTLLGSGIANITREEVSAQCGGNASHGFSFNMPESIKDGKEHQIYAQATNIEPPGENPLLSNSPKTITCAPPPTPTPTPTPSPSPTRAECDWTSPTITVTPDGVSAKPGETATFSVTLRGNDTKSCNERLIAFDLILPSANWSYSPSEVTLGSREVKTFNIIVTSPSTASIGTKSLFLRVRGGRNNTTFVTKTLTYTLTEN